MAFYFPLGFGAGGIALCIAAVLTREGGTPWWALIAVAGSLAALGLGIDAYDAFQAAQEDLSDAQRDLDNLLGP